MPHPDVRAWLDQADPSYAAGLTVLASTGYDQSSLTWALLQRGADSFTRPKLRELLTAVIAGAITVPPVAPVAAPVTVPANERKPGLNPAIPALLDQRTEAKARLRAILDDPDRAEERRVLALSIKDITDQLDRLYHPEAFVAPPKPALKLTKANLRTYVSRYRKRTREHPDNAEYARLLTHYETLLTQLPDETPL